MSQSLGTKQEQYKLPVNYESFGKYVLGDVCPTTGTVFIKPVPKLVHTKGLVLRSGKVTHISLVAEKDQDECVPFARHDFNPTFSLCDQYVVVDGRSSTTKRKVNELFFNKIARASRAEVCFLPSGELVGSADPRLKRGGRNPKDQAEFAKLCTMTKEERIAVIKAGELETEGATKGKRVATGKSGKAKKTDKRWLKDRDMMWKFLQKADLVDYLTTGRIDEWDDDAFPFHRKKYTEELERMLKLELR